MSYSANQYNYATPLSNIDSLAGQDIDLQSIDRKYFVLSNNTLDGSCEVVPDSVGLWGAELPNTDGTLTNPLVVTVNENTSINAFRLVGSKYCYPVDFTVKFYSGNALLSTLVEVGNSDIEYLNKFQSTLNVDKYEVTITKVSSAEVPVRLFNVYNPGYVSRVDNFNVGLTELSEASWLRTFSKADSLKLHSVESEHTLNTINLTRDTLVVKNEEKATPTNIHTVMKEPFRQVFGKVLITYTDPMLDSETIVTSEYEAYNSNREQLLDDNIEPMQNYFTLYDNDLSGKYLLLDELSQIGWVSSSLSRSDGTFDEDPSVTVHFAARPIVSLVVTFDNSKGNLVKDFSVIFLDENGVETIKEFKDNTNVSVSILDGIDDTITEVVSVTVIVHRVTAPNSPAIIIDMPVSSTILYKGYDDVSDLMSIDLLEELTYEDEIEALGGISANEVTVIMDNSDRKFFFNRNNVSAKHLKRNRKIEPWLGAEIIPGIIEWYKLGTFWSYNWDVPVNGLTAKVVGFDTIGLLSTTSYERHSVQINKTLGYLIEYVLEDAKRDLNFIEYYIDASLYNIVIPYAWFERSNHTAALKRIASCYPMHIYCDRDGRICAMPQKLNLEYYLDKWSGSTNVIKTDYSSLYTTLPNIVNITISNTKLLQNEVLVYEQGDFDVVTGETLTLAFGKPYVQRISIDIESDQDVQYTYEVFSWGISITFNGNYTIHAITCKGTCLDTSTVSIITKKDLASIRVNGAITRHIESEFIQTASLANVLIDRIFSLSENDKYDATVEYRGDISLTINDPIWLVDGIAPNNNYNIKRHELSWNGALSGSAELNT